MFADALYVTLGRFFLHCMREMQPVHREGGGKVLAGVVIYLGFVL